MSTKKKPAAKKLAEVKRINVAFNGHQFSKDLIATRERLDLTQKQAAVIAGVSQPTVFDAESKQSCSLRSLPGLCNLIGKPIQEYFKSQKQ